MSCLMYWHHYQRKICFSWYFFLFCRCVWLVTWLCGHVSSASALSRHADATIRDTCTSIACDRKSLRIPWGIISKFSIIRLTICGHSYEKNAFSDAIGLAKIGVFLASRHGVAQRFSLDFLKRAITARGVTNWPLKMIADHGQCEVWIECLMWTKSSVRQCSVLVELLSVSWLP